MKLICQNNISYHLPHTNPVNPGQPWSTLDNSGQHVPSHAMFGAQHPAPECEMRSVLNFNVKWKWVPNLCSTFSLIFSGILRTLDKDLLGWSYLKYQTDILSNLVFYIFFMTNINNTSYKARVRYGWIEQKPKCYYLMVAVNIVSACPPTNCSYWV